MADFSTHLVIADFTGYFSGGAPPAGSTVTFTPQPGPFENLDNGKIEGTAFTVPISQYTGWMGERDPLADPGDPVDLDHTGVRLADTDNSNLRDAASHWWQVDIRIPGRAVQTWGITISSGDPAPLPLTQATRIASSAGAISQGVRVLDEFGHEFAGVTTVTFAGPATVTKYSANGVLVDAGSGPSAPVNTVTASAPLASSGGDNPDISLSGQVDIAHGGTGAGTQAGARTALGLGTAAVLNVPASGNAASGEVVKGSDTRLADTRTPAAHASSHISTGSDAIPGAVASGASGLLTGSDKAKLDGLTALTTKGDLLSYSTNAARLPVGSNGQVLVADSTQTLGVKWMTPMWDTGKDVDFSADGSAIFRITTAQTLDIANAVTDGTGTAVYAKALAGSPSSYSTITTSTSFAVGDRFKITASGVSGVFAVSVPRTA